MRRAFAAAGFAARTEAVASPPEAAWALADASPDLVFSTFFRFRGLGLPEDSLPCLSAKAGAVWIGSSEESLVMALSKPMLKERWQSDGIATPEWHVVRSAGPGELEGLEALEALRDFPYFVKPACEGNSRGVDLGSVVRGPGELLSRARLIAEQFGEALVEAYVGGPDSREFTVAMIGNGPRSIVSGVELALGGPLSRAISEADKDGHRTRVSPITDPRLKARVEGLARRAFASAGARDYSRCDIILQGDRLWAIEVNGQPMVPDRWFEACAAGAGLGNSQYLQAIALAAMARAADSGLAFIPITRELRGALPPPALALLLESKEHA